MPTITQPSVNFTGEFVPDPQGLAMHLDQIPNLILTGKNIDLSALKNAYLSDPPIKTADGTVNFDRSFTIGQESLQVKANASATLRVIAPTKPDTTLFDPDLFGDNIVVGENERYVCFGFDASASAGATADLGNFAFGSQAGGTLSFATYRRFDVSGLSPKFFDAVAETVAGFVIPAHVSDLENMAIGEIVTVETTGNLQFSLTANLLTFSNPLVTVPVPDRPSGVELAAGGSMQVGAAYTLSGGYQMRVWKLSANRVRLSYHKSRDSDLAVTSDASIGVTASVDGKDLFARVLKTISKDPAGDLAVIAGLQPREIQAIEDATQKSIERKLEVAVSAEVNAADQTDAIFAIDAYLPALNETERTAIESALHGNIAKLAEGSPLPAGISLVGSKFTHLKETGTRLRVNLFGIFTYGSVANLVRQRLTWVGPDGSLNISDSATASRVKFGADRDAFRMLLAETFLITAGWMAGSSGPNLSCTHTWLELHDRTKAETMRGELDIALGLGAIDEAALQAILGVRGEFGKTEAHAYISYNDSILRAGFLDASGDPWSAEVYDRIGRAAMRMLVAKDGDDSFRLEPLEDDELWLRMRKLGQPGIIQMFGPEHGPVIAADYTKIAWWTDSMHETATILSLLRRNPNDPGVPAKRDELAKQLAKLASETSSHLNEPWGIVVMYLATGSRGQFTIEYIGPYVNREYQSTPAPQSLKVAA